MMLPRGTRFIVCAHVSYVRYIGYVSHSRQSSLIGIGVIVILHMEPRLP